MENQSQSTQGDTLAMHGPTIPENRGPASSRLRRLAAWFGQPIVVSVLLLGYAAGAYYANLWIQIFCQPVAWASCVLVVTFLPVVFWPVLQRRATVMLPICQLLRGIAFCCCLYMMIFLGPLNVALPVLSFLGIGLLGYTPHVFAMILIYQNWISGVRAQARSYFLAGIALSMLTATYFIWDFQAAIPIARALAANPAPYEGPHAGAVEWILGMHFKYHTQPEIFDGWRPPLHDPAGVIGFWGNAMRDPLPTVQPYHLWARMTIYHVVFPELHVQVNCTCALNADAMRYLHDPIFDDFTK